MIISSLFLCKLKKLLEVLKDNKDVFNIKSLLELI